MASRAQCFYCFECLAASFEDREPADLEVIEDLWEQYEQTKKLATIEDKNDLESAEEDNERSQHTVHDDDEQDYQSGDVDGNSSTRDARPGTLKLPSISRLQSELSSESSSAATTPSSTSNKSVSSNSTAVTTPTVASPPSEAPALSSQRPKSRHHPLFVTWNTVMKNRKSLRGCIGTFESQELSDGLRSYALISYVYSHRWCRKLLLPYSAF